MRGARVALCMGARGRRTIALPLRALFRSAAWMPGLVACIVIALFSASAGALTPAAKAKTKDRSGHRGAVGKGDKAEKEHFAGARAAAKACDYRTPLHHHTVQWGENLSGIAGTYGVTHQAILAQNPGLKDPDRLRLGQVLAVCPEIAPREQVVGTYVVRESDTLHQIAKKHGLSLKELVRMQGPGFDETRHLRAGQKVRTVLSGAVLPGFSADEESTSSLELSSASRAVVHQLPSRSIYRIKRPERTFGTQRAVSAILTAATHFSRRSGGQKFLVGDLSRKKGGQLSGHRSHRTGTDVDVGLFLRNTSVGQRFVTASPKTLDARLSWLLISSFLKTGMVRYIFLDYALQAELYAEAKRRGASEAMLDETFQYPRGKHRRYGIIRDWPNHRDHFHVRFRH